VGGFFGLVWDRVSDNRILLRYQEGNKTLEDLRIDGMIILNKSSRNMKNGIEWIIAVKHRSQSGIFLIRQ
jgi:hypothetical protein